MDNRQAERSLADAQAAHTASSRPSLPTALAAVTALAAGGGVALVGQSSDRSWLHVAFVVGGLLLMVTAFAIPVAHRRRAGLHGFRGRVRSDNLVFALCAVSLFINGMTADRVLSAIYIGIGAVVAICYFPFLREPARSR